MSLRTVYACRNTSNKSKSTNNYDIPTLLTTTNLLSIEVICVSLWNSSKDSTCLSCWEYRRRRVSHLRKNKCGNWSSVCCLSWNICISTREFFTEIWIQLTSWLTTTLIWRLLISVSPRQLVSHSRCPAASSAPLLTRAHKSSPIKITQTRQTFGAWAVSSTKLWNLNRHLPAPTHLCSPKSLSIPHTNSSRLSIAKA